MTYRSLENTIKDAINEAFINHREYAQHGLMHPTFLKHMQKPGQYMDFYAHKTGDKVYGKVVSNNGKTVVMHHDGKSHTYKVSDKLPTPDLDEGAPVPKDDGKNDPRPVLNDSKKKDKKNPKSQDEKPTACEKDPVTVGPELAEAKLSKEQKQKNQVGRWSEFAKRNSKKFMSGTGIPRTNGNYTVAHHVHVGKNHAPRVEKEIRKHAKAFGVGLHLSRKPGKTPHTRHIHFAAHGEAGNVQQFWNTVNRIYPKNK